MNVFNLRLAREIIGRRGDARILVTRPGLSDTKPFPRPADVPVEDLPVPGREFRRKRWAGMTDYLERHAPCLYLPNHDLEYSCVSPVLSERVGVVGIVHSDDPEHAEHVRRLGKYWDAVVTVSDRLTLKTLRANPALSGRVVKIAHGVPVPPAWTPRDPDPASPLKMIYAGILKQYQKRVLDLTRIVRRLDLKGVPFELTLAGGGPDQGRLLSGLQPMIRRGKVRYLGILPPDRLGPVFSAHDLFILPSEFEGMPTALLEAMAGGCVPLVTEVASGIPELVESGVNGFRVPVGDIERFADGAKRLQNDKTLLNRMSQAAHETVVRGGYTVSAMADHYLNLFAHVMTPRMFRDGRRAGKILPPPRLAFYQRNRWLTPLRDARRVLISRWRKMDAALDSLWGQGGEDP